MLMPMLFRINSHSSLTFSFKLCIEQMGGWATIIAPPLKMFNPSHACDAYIASGSPVVENLKSWLSEKDSVISSMD